MSALPLRIVAVDPATGSFHLDPDNANLQKEAEVTYTDGKMRTPDPNFQTDYASHLLDPLRRLASSLPAEPAAVPVHAECLILTHIETLMFNNFDLSRPMMRPHIRYIGTSEPSCLPALLSIHRALQRSTPAKAHARARLNRSNTVGLGTTHVPWRLQDHSNHGNGIVSGSQDRVQRRAYTHAFHTSSRARGALRGALYVCIPCSEAFQPCAHRRSSDPGRAPVQRSGLQVYGATEYATCHQFILPPIGMTSILRLHRGSSRARRCR